MKAALKTLAIVWSCISVVSLAGLLYLLPSYGIVGAFAGVFRATPQSDELARWFHICEMSLVLGTLMTAWLWRTHRTHYGKLEK